MLAVTLLEAECARSITVETQQPARRIDRFPVHILPHQLHVRDILPATFCSQHGHYFRHQWHNRYSPHLCRLLDVGSPSEYFTQRCAFASEACRGGANRSHRYQRDGHHMRVAQDERRLAQDGAEGPEGSFLGAAAVVRRHGERDTELQER